MYYSDAKSFGGHEVASLHALQWMIDEGAILDCFFREANHSLTNRLHRLAIQYPQLTLHPLNLPRIRFHRLFHFFRPKTVEDLGERFRQLQPDLVFTSQGNLEISALGVIAAHRQHIPCISYIPMAHSFRKMKSKQAWIRDWFNRYTVKLPSIWLTCTHQQVEKLRKLGAKQPIYRLPNCIAISTPATKSQAREVLGIEADRLVLGMVGRLNNKQKGCDIFVDALTRSATESTLRTADLLFIGNDADWLANRKRLEASSWRGRIHHIEWTDQPECYYAAFDLLVMPSHFEGLPLAMQEALLCDVPIAASAVDGLKSFLPSKWLCPPNSADSLRHLLENFLNDPRQYRSSIPQLQEIVRTAYSVQSVQAVLKQAFDRVLSKQPEDTDRPLPSSQIPSTQRV